MSDLDINFPLSCGALDALHKTLSTPPRPIKVPECAECWTRDADRACPVCHRAPLCESCAVRCCEGAERCPCGGPADYACGHCAVTGLCGKCLDEHRDSEHPRPTYEPDPFDVWRESEEVRTEERELWGEDGL
jgi:hypothetical protein